MRVIAGSARGARLGRVPRGTRPLSDRAREGLFASLGRSVENAGCVDLFAGTGAVGIEALSRGARRCVFVDSAPSAARAVRENLLKTRLDDRATVVRSPVERYLERSDEEFDIAFLDPPYDLPAEELGAVLKKLSARLAPDAMVALTRPSRNDSDVVPVDWRIVRRLTYGDTGVLLCREGP